MTSSTPRRARRGLFASLTALAAGTALFLGSGAASAQDDDVIRVAYDVNGSTYTAGTGSTITLGPAEMTTSVDDDGFFLGEMALPGTRTTFSLAGFLPVTADVNFEPVGPTTGEIKVVDVRFRALETESTYYVRLSNIRVGGLPILTGSNCRTINPVVIQADTPEGEYFNFVTGGNLRGEYSIGNFQNCGLFGGQTHLINALIPGDGNTIDLQLTDGRALN